MIILAVLLAVVALIAVGVAIFVSDHRVVAGVVGVVALIIGGALGFFSAIYTQDTGEASVIIDWTGNIQGQETSPGLHFKSPFASVQTFNVRNQQVSFVGTGNTNYSGGSAEGPQITVSDRNGVTSNLDVSVRYSIRADQVTAIYRQFHDESSFAQNYVVQTIRSTVRDVPNGYSTLDLITKRAEINNAIQLALEKAWSGTGVSVDSVSLQEIRPPRSVTDSYASAQQAQINVSTEQNRLAAAKVSAQQTVVQAQAQAQANEFLAKSLTDPILKQHALDTMAKLAASGNLVVTDSQGSTLLNVK